MGNENIDNVFRLGRVFMGANQIRARTSNFFPESFKNLH